MQLSCAWYPVTVQAAISDVGIRDRTWRCTLRLRMVTAAGTAMVSTRTTAGLETPTVVCAGFWLYFRPYAALVLYSVGAGLREQGAAVA